MAEERRWGTESRESMKEEKPRAQVTRLHMKCKLAGKCMPSTGNWNTFITGASSLRIWLEKTYRNWPRNARCKGADEENAEREEASTRSRADARRERSKEQPNPSQSVERARVCALSNHTSKQAGSFAAIVVVAVAAKQTELSFPFPSLSPLFKGVVQRVTTRQSVARHLPSASHVVLSR